MMHNIRYYRFSLFLSGCCFIICLITACSPSWSSIAIPSPSWNSIATPTTSGSKGAILYTYRGHSSIVTAVAWSPDGTLIASANQYRTVQVWDAATGRYVFTYRGHSSSVNGVAWSPDGKRIASASDDHTVQVWDAITGGDVFIYYG